MLSLMTFCEQNENQLFSVYSDHVCKDTKNNIKAS